MGEVELKTEESIFARITELFNSVPLFAYR